ncbi:MAG: tRNA (guanosine(37)-N1)-methyltransferase TrmD [Haliangiales bacterium]
MRFTAISIFPELFAPSLAVGVLGRAVQSGALAVEVIDPRDFTTDRHRTVDDTPYGGGPGMVMKVEPLVAAIESAQRAGEPPPHRVLLSPAGRPLTQARVRELAALPHLVLVCGRYEGIDQRVVEVAIDEELSIGDFVLTGGELGALAIIDAVARYLPGVLGAAASTDEESFSEGLLEYPQYTRPAEFAGRAVPEILSSGHHDNIRRWRRQQALARTAARRPDLFARHRLTAEDEALWRELGASEPAANVYVALVHHPVHDRNRRVVTSAITNLDLHDIARSTTTYGLAGYFVVTPVTAQRDKAARILSVWTDSAEATHPSDNRGEALARVEAVADLDAACAAIEARHGVPPRVIATSAQAGSDALGFGALAAELRADPERPVLLMFGTGWGLAEAAMARAERVLAPIAGRPAFNHLSVRSAVAIVLDRLFGLREP